MPKLKIAATKMTDAKVSFISLVERGANRIPFKIVKQEKQMAGATKGLDLGSLFARKADKPKIEVVGVVTLKGEGFDSVKGQIEEAGFAVGESLDMEDNSVVFKQVDSAEGEGVVVRLSEHVALVTKGFSPYNMDLSEDGTSFADKCKAQGFYPGVRSAMEVASESVMTLAYNQASPGEATKAISKLMDEVKAYVVSLASALPQKAFKLEEVFPEEPETPNGDGVESDVEKAEKAKAKGKLNCKSCGAEYTFGDKECAECGADPMADPDKDGDAASDKDKDGDGKGKKAKKEDSSADAAGDQEQSPEGNTAEESVTTGLTEEQVSAIVATKLDAAVGSFSTKMEEMIAQVQKSMSDTLSGVSQQIEGLAGRVEKAESEASNVANVMKGTMVGGSDAGDHAPVTQKSESSRAGREIDTAFMGSVRKSARNR